MNISELNYLEVVNQEADIRGGGLLHETVRVDKDVDINKDVKIDVDKMFKTFSFVKGNVADAEAAATAHGWDSNAETLTITQTDPYSSAAYSESLSQSDY